MTDTTAAVPKPSSSVKLVLLGEAAVGKVRDHCLAPRSCQTMTDHISLVLPRPPFRQQRFPGKQGTHYRWYVVFTSLPGAGSLTS